MLVLAGRRLASMILIMIVISILLFLIFEADKSALADARARALFDNGRPAAMA